MRVGSDPSVSIPYSSYTELKFKDQSSLVYTYDSRPLESVCGKYVTLYRSKPSSHYFLITNIEVVGYIA